MNTLKHLKHDDEYKLLFVLWLIDALEQQTFKQAQKDIVYYSMLLKALHHAYKTKEFNLLPFYILDIINLYIDSFRDLTKEYTTRFKEKTLTEQIFWINLFAVHYQFNITANSNSTQEHIISSYTTLKTYCFAYNNSNRFFNKALYMLMLYLGIRVAFWDYTNRFREHPRINHRNANGKKFYIEKGCLINGEYIYPGELYGCKCAYSLGVF